MQVGREGVLGLGFSKGVEGREGVLGLEFSKGVGGAGSGC